MCVFLNNILQNLRQEHERWSLWIPVLFAIGIGFYFLLPCEVSIWWSLLVAELLIFLAICFRHRIVILSVLGLFSIIVLGFINIQLKATYLNTANEIKNEEKLYISGKIEKTGFNYRGNQRLTLTETTNFEQNRNLGRVRISTRSKNLEFKPGQCIEAVVQLMPLSKPVLPNGYQFDRKAYFEKLDASGYAISDVLEIECDTKPSLFARFFYAIDDLRFKIIRHIRKTLPSDQASIAAAIIAGEQGVISQKIIQNYRDSGLAHFLSISGLHMTMIAGLMFFLVRLIIVFLPKIACDQETKIVVTHGMSSINDIKESKQAVISYSSDSRQMQVSLDKNCNNIHVSLFDVMGKNLLSDHFKDARNILLDLSTIPSDGLCIVQLTYDNHIQTQKIIL